MGATNRNGPSKSPVSEPLTMTTIISTKPLDVKAEVLSLQRAANKVCSSRATAMRFLRKIQAPVAQLAERGSLKPVVAGSTPAGSTI